MPGGYTANELGCLAVLVTVGGTPSCTIVNTLNTATFNVNKDFSDNNPADVTVTLVCDSGLATPTDPTASESNDANFTVTGFTGDPNCTATELPVLGYSSSLQCSAALSAGSCTIVNTLNSGVFQVVKDFSDNNPADVIVTVTCTSGVAIPTDPTASESDPADFTINGFTPGASCTATEPVVPVGYTQQRHLHSDADRGYLHDHQHAQHGALHCGQRLRAEQPRLGQR